MYVASMAAIGSWVWIFAWLRGYGLTWRGYTWVLVAILLNGCALTERISEFTLKDAQAALARAERGKDTGGAMCWRFVVERLESNDLTLDIVGIMDMVEAARLARIQAPTIRQEITKNCGEVFADVIVEIGKRAKNRGL
jgi:hypothetical protein